LKNPCVSSYPSDTQACNVSRDTTKKEIISIEGKDKTDLAYMEKPSELEKRNRQNLS